LLPGANKHQPTGWRLAKRTRPCLALPECLPGPFGRQMQATHANAWYETFNRND
jgi:hypothetical protein